MARRRVDKKVKYPVLVLFDDAREIRKIEARLWRYGEIHSNFYVRDYDDRGRLRVTAVFYVLHVSLSRLRETKIGLTMLGQENKVKVLH